jgi:transposase-like protein
MSMPEIARHTGGDDAIQLGFVERIYTPIGLMEYAIELHLNGLSLSDTALALERFGIDRAKSTIHNWVQKSDLEPREGLSPDNVELDETVIKVKGERFWLDGAVNPETNQILHIRLYPTRNTAVTQMFLNELDEKHDIRDAEFFVDGAPWLQAGLFELDVHFHHETFGERNPVERVFQEIKRRTEQFYNHFGNADTDTVENWLVALAWAENCPN